MKPAEVATIIGTAVGFVSTIAFVSYLAAISPQAPSPNIF